jgi:hypothetical protein
MINKLTSLAMAAVLMAACAQDTTIPNEADAQVVTPANQQVMPGRFGMFQRLREEGDSLTLALLDRAEEARQNAREAYRSGDTATARISRLEARGYMHTAVTRTFPEMAQQMEGCRAQEAVGSCGMNARGNRGAGGAAQDRGMRSCQNQESTGACGMDRMDRRGMAGAAGGGGMMGGQGRRAERWSQLRAEADDSSLALLDRAAEARDAARAALRAGDEEEAKARMQEARDAMHAAMVRTDPEMADRMQQQRGQRMGKGRRGMSRR